MTHVGVGIPRIRCNPWTATLNLLSTVFPRDARNSSVYASCNPRATGVPKRGDQETPCFSTPSMCI